MHMIKLKALAVLAALIGVGFADHAAAQSTIGWRDNATSYRGQNGNRLTFVCAGGGSANTVWGSDVYTDDSSICTAAVHSGAIGWGGGIVTILIQPGLPGYSGSSRNGVTTQNYPAWTGSFSVLGGSGGGGGGGSPASWSANAQAYLGQSGPVTIICSANGNHGSVWGTDYYTTDSSICTAAVHAGVLNESRGGNVTFYLFGGLSGYPGSSRNGITSSTWGSYTSTFAFTPNPPVNARPITWTANGASVVSAGQTAFVMCPSGGSAGSVWGTDVYTSDSSICTAAVHAGVIGFGGGVVQVTGEGGRPSYPGSSRNGVSTSRWGSYGASFSVQRPR